MLRTLEFFFAPAGQPWYTGAVWGNVVAILPCALLAWFWARTKVVAVHTKLTLLHEKHRELQDRHIELQQQHNELQNALASVSGPEASNLGG